MVSVTYLPRIGDLIAFTIALVKTMASRFGYDVLYPFDVWDEAKDFLAEIIETRAAPQAEFQSLLQESLVAGSDDWHHWIGCATSMRASNHSQRHEIEGTDVLEYLLQVASISTPIASSLVPWADTDRLIAQAKALEQDVETHLNSLRDTKGGESTKTSAASVPASVKGKSQGKTSHYWDTDSASTQALDIDASHPQKSRTADLSQPNCHYSANTHPGSHHLNDPGYRGLGERWPLLNAQDVASKCRGTLSSSVGTQSSPVSKPNKASHSSSVSHYFKPTNPNPVQSPSKRPPPGTVSSIPFPSLAATHFGIIQEKLAHEPFWLLIAITFLIKTRGTQAIPTFLKVRERYPTPTHLADPAIEEELLGMIRHLGLSVVRVAYIQKYARLFLKRPPKAGVKYKVKMTGKRATSWLSSVRETPAGRDPIFEELKEDVEAWEIGHMTCGKYAIDSWRIFCRDELLGQAEDWNGKGREPEFQPEWMRVLPDDKELRAYLRWMWMREGWEWDPVTGERGVLRAEMQAAVNEGRVAYDNTGGLQILDGVGHESESTTKMGSASMEQ